MSKEYSFRLGSICGGYVLLSRSELSTGGYRLHFDVEISRWK